MADIENPDLFACSSRTWISLDTAHFYEEHCQPSSGSAWLGFPNNGNQAPIAGDGRCRQNLHRVCQTAVGAPPRVGGVVWSLFIACPILNCMIHYNVCNEKGKYCGTVEIIVGGCIWQYHYPTGLLALKLKCIPCTSHFIITCLQSALKLFCAQ